MPPLMNLGQTSHFPSSLPQKQKHCLRIFPKALSPAPSGADGRFHSRGPRPPPPPPSIPPLDGAHPRPAPLVGEPPPVCSDVTRPWRRLATSPEEPETNRKRRGRRVHGVPETVRAHVGPRGDGGGGCSASSCLKGQSGLRRAGGRNPPRGPTAEGGATRRGGAQWPVESLGEVGSRCVAGAPRGGVSPEKCRGALTSAGRC